MTLDRDDVEAIAHRVAELIAGQPPTAEYLDTAKVATMLDASEEWVRDHAAELGALRLGDGPKGALRFRAERIRKALEHRRLGESPRRPARRRPRRPRTASGVELLPLPDEP